MFNYYHVLFIMAKEISQEGSGKLSICYLSSMKGQYVLFMGALAVLGLGTVFFGYKTTCFV